MFETDFADELIQNKGNNEDYTILHDENEFFSLHHIKIHNENNSLHKPIGDYVTIDIQDIYDHMIQEEVSKQLAYSLQALCLDHSKIKKFLIVGLGNQNIVSDALGPMVLQDIQVTAHYHRMHHPTYSKHTRDVAAIIPGVMSKTGLESAHIIKSIHELYESDCIIVIDALATNNLKRINQVIQINNVGIQPGSGVGNHRLSIDANTFQVPVLAIGVATVMRVSSIIKEACGHDPIKGLNENLTKMILTPKSIDDAMLHFKSMIAHGINMFLHPNLYEEHVENS